MSEQHESTDTHAQVVELDRREAELLLASHHAGRVAVTVHGHPRIVPVDYATPGGGVIVFRADPDSILMEASLRDVAFEIDDIDTKAQSSWSVTVEGLARDISDAIDLASARLRQLPLDTWAPGDYPEWFKIEPSTVTGQRVQLR